MTSITKRFRFEKSASIAFDGTNASWAKSNPIYKQKRARVQGENPYILALFVFINEWMLTHHELASPLIARGIATQFVAHMN